MSAGPRLVLTQSTGWFAAGWTFAEAMTVLSDAAFKLFAWLCLNADRHTGRVHITVAEIAQCLGKSEGEIEAAREELAESGVCRVEDIEVEIADCYWPYEKQASQAGAEEYVAQVRRLVSEPACVRCRFTAIDEKIARAVRVRRHRFPPWKRIAIFSRRGNSVQGVTSLTGETEHCPEY